MTVELKVKFETTASRRTLMHKGRQVALDSSGEGKIKVEPGEWDLILFAFVGPPGTKAKITLTQPAGYGLEISGHPIQAQIAQGKQISGGNRFFRVKEGA